MRNGKPIAVPSSVSSAITSPLFSFKAKLRILREPFIPPTKDTNESLASFVRRRLGNEFLDYAINPMVGGVYAGDPEILSVRHAFPKVWYLESEYKSLIRGAIAKMREKRRCGSQFKTHLLSWQNGMETLTKTLAHPLDVRTGCRLDQIKRDGKLWLVHWEQSGLRFFEACERIIIAVPAYILNNLPLPPQVLKILEPLIHIAYPPVSMLALGFPREAIQHPLDGFGMLIPEIEKFNILGTLFSSTLFPARAPEGHVLLTSFIGGSRQPENARLPKAELERLVLHDLNKLLGVSAPPVFSKHIFWSRAIPQYTTDYDHYLNALIEAENTHPGLQFTGNYRDGIALGKCLINSNK